MNLKILGWCLDNRYVLCCPHFHPGLAAFLPQALVYAMIYVKCPLPLGHHICEHPKRDIADRDFRWKAGAYMSAYL